MIKVIDNFLSPSYFNLIEKICLTELDGIIQKILLILFLPIIYLDLVQFSDT